MLEIFEGACQCGELRYRVKGRVATLFACHCSECQRQSSSAFGMALWVRDYERQIFGGETASWVRKTPSGKELVCEFCARCGTRLFHHMRSTPEILSIKPGTLDDTRDLEPAAHIWTSSAQRWVRFQNGCVCYPQNPAAFDELFTAWQARDSARREPPST